MANICVTGGAGYIGSHCVDYILKNTEHSVIVIDNLSTGNKWAIDNCAAHRKTTIPFYRASIDDCATVESILRNHHIDAVIHFAAFSLVAESQENPLKYYANNTASTIRLLETLAKCGVHTFVFSSTASVYGNALHDPIEETHSLEPINHYGKSKLLIERVLQEIAPLHHINYVALRYFNVAGADGDTHIGEVHVPETHLIPLILKAALGIRDKAYIFGTDYPTKDGTAIRDYIHVTDLVRAHVNATELLMQKGGAYSINLGSENGYSVKEVVDTVRQVTQRDFIVENSARRPGDPPVLRASIKKAKEILGWQPGYNLHEMVYSAYKWEQKVWEKTHIL